MAKKNRIPHKFQPWIDARRKFHLSDAQIQMARELGLSPKRFGSYANVKDQPWKLPLVQFIEALYEKQFGRTRPVQVRSLEQLAADHVAKRTARKAAQLNNPEPSNLASTPGELADTEMADTVITEGATAVRELGGIDLAGITLAGLEQADTEPDENE